MIRKSLTEDEIFEAAMAALSTMDLQFSERTARVIACKALLDGSDAKAAVEAILDDWATEYFHKQTAIAEALDEASAKRANETSDHDPAKERRAMTPKMRLAVIHADAYKCRACGAGADVAQLHVDHILPISRGGKTDFENLQTLCEACNLAKSSNIVDIPKRSAAALLGGAK